MCSVPDEAIPAATLLVLRDAPAFEVLMVERHADIGFAGGALVFPGGRIDEADGDPAWEAHCPGLTGAPAHRRAAVIAAIREAFEETGLLLARRTGEADYVGDGIAGALDAHRGAVEQDAREFLPLIAREKLQLACDALCYFAHWIAPKGVHKRRYDTRFFAARAPADQRAREDGNEATEAVWIEPNAALAAREQGTRKMIFPTARNVELLSVSDSADAVFSYAAERNIETVQPRVIERDGAKFLTIPDGLGYPVTQEPLESALGV